MDPGPGDVESQQPLKGAILCSTAIDQDVRAEIVKYAEAMGAVYRLDLTSDVTHMIVGDVNTPKYKHIARSRFDVHVLSVEWIYALRDAWTNAHDMNYDTLLAKFRLPTFYGLKICVTGFSNLAQRQSIQDNVQNNGGEYHGALTKQITHLIVASTDGLKYKQACTWNITIVTLAWFDASLERGLILDESYYSPTIPADRQGVGALAPIARTTKRSRQSDGKPSQGETVKRKMRRTASAKLDSQTQTLWADITNIQHQETAPQPDAWIDVDAEITANAGKDDNATLPALAQTTPQSARLFSEWTCCLYGFSQKLEAKVLEVLRANGAIICKEMQLLNNMTENEAPLRVLIAPSYWHGKTHAQSLTVVPGVRYATELWIERCIFAQRAIDPAEDIYSRLLVGLSASCFAGLRISCSGFGTDVIYFSKLIEAGGGEYLPRFVSSASLLVGDEDMYSNVKLVYAVKHKIPVVTKGWFLACLEKGQRQPCDAYLMAQSRLLSARGDMSMNLDGAGGPPADTSTAQKEPQKKTFLGQRLSSTRLRSSHSVLPLTKRVATFNKSDDRRFASIDAVMQQEVPGPFIAEPPSPVSQKPASGEDRVERSEPSGGVDLPVIEEEPPQSPAAAPTVEIPAPADVDKENMSAEPGTDAKATTDAAPDDDLVNVMSELLNRQQSRSATTDDTSHRPRRRKDMKLGRAASGAHNTNLTRPTTLEVADTEESTSSLSLSASNNGQSFAATESTGGLMSLAPLPSQQLLYEAPGADEHRRAMSKRLGCEFVEEESMGTRVQKLGVVQDADVKAYSAAGQRTRGKPRG